MVFFLRWNGSAMTLNSRSGLIDGDSAMGRDPAESEANDQHAQKEPVDQPRTVVVVVHFFRMRRILAM